MDNQRMISFVQDIIRTPSLSGDEKAVVEKIVQEMEQLGFDEVQVDKNGSGIGIIHGQKPGKTLLLDGHCDHVDVIPSDWSHPPFAAEIADGYIFGRATADMKASLAAMIYAAARVDRSRLAGSVAVSATVLEEVMEGGALKSVVDIVKPDYVIIGEATNFNLKHAGRGRAEIIVETYGKSAHSSSPQAGLCAVHEMYRVIQSLDTMALPSHPQIGSGLNVLTDIISEPYPGKSVLPNVCRVSYDRRLLPGETAGSVISEIKSLPELQGIDFNVSILDREEKTYTGKTLSGQKFFPAWIFDQEHPLVQGALKGLHQAGIKPGLSAYQFCTNGAYSGGTAGIPTIGFGPGGETDAHTVDEHIKIADLELAVDCFNSMIMSILSE